MAGLVLRFVLCIAAVSLINGLESTLPASPCGDWFPYKDEYCVKLVDRVGLQTKVDADIICKAFGVEFEGDAPRLVSVKTKEKQEFLQKRIFEDLDTLDNVWLGLDLGKDDVFRWNDETDLFYTNWIVNNGKIAMADHERSCVQMESGESGVIEAGKWATANCKKRNAVVCERIQPMSLIALQTYVLKLKLETQRMKYESEEANKKIVYLEKNPVPVGFIYVQLPGRDPPQKLWNQTEWENIGLKKEYAGLFFRVEGSPAAHFEDPQAQSDSTRSLAQVEYDYDKGSHQPTIPSNSSWSDFAYSGGNGGSRSICLRFRLTKGEVRPKNKSVRIWQRVK